MRIIISLSFLLACSPDAEVPAPEPAPVAAPSGPAEPVDAPPPPVPVVDVSKAVTRSTAKCTLAASCESDCRVGDALACSQLGLWYQYGLAGVEEDPARAADLQKRACDLGAGSGCFSLAVQRTYGIGVLRDPALAEALLGRAAALHEASCEGGAIGWCVNHADMLLKGQGVKADKHRAVAILREKCSGGLADACVQLSTAIKKSDLGAARVLLQKSCGNGEMVSCGYLGETYLDEDPPDPKAANLWFKSGCEAKQPQACRNLGYQMITGQGTEQDAPLGLTLLDSACRSKKSPDGGACHLAGVTLLTGAPGVMPDMTRAGERLGQACMMGQGVACLQSAQLLASGKIPQGRYSALELTEMACFMGMADACRLMKGEGG